jgi:CubicO group peptidase (beta-lactamase class C family)
MRYALSILIIGLISVNSFGQNAEMKSLDSLLSAIYTKDNPGAAVAILKNGKVFFKKGYGLAEIDSKKAVSLSTNFNNGSQPL